MSKNSTIHQYTVNLATALSSVKFKPSVISTLKLSNTAQSVIDFTDYVCITDFLKEDRSKWFDLLHQWMINGDINKFHILIDYITRENICLDFHCIDPNRIETPYSNSLLTVQFNIRYQSVRYLDDITVLLITHKDTTFHKYQQNIETICGYGSLYVLKVLISRLEDDMCGRNDENGKDNGIKSIYSLHAPIDDDDNDTVDHIDRHHALDINDNNHQRADSDGEFDGFGVIDGNSDDFDDFNHFDDDEDEDFFNSSDDDDDTNDNFNAFRHRHNNNNHNRRNNHNNLDRNNQPIEDDDDDEEGPFIPVISPWERRQQRQQRRGRNNHQNQLNQRPIEGNNHTISHSINPFKTLPDQIILESLISTWTSGGMGLNGRPLNMNFMLKKFPQQIPLLSSSINDGIDAVFDNLTGMPDKDLPSIGVQMLYVMYKHGVNVPRNIHRFATPSRVISIHNELSGSNAIRWYFEHCGVGSIDEFCAKFKYVCFSQYSYIMSFFDNNHDNDDYNNNNTTPFDNHITLKSNNNNHNNKTKKNKKNNNNMITHTSSSSLSLPSLPPPSFSMVEFLRSTHNINTKCYERFLSQPNMKRDINKQELLLLSQTPLDIALTYSRFNAIDPLIRFGGNISNQAKVIIDKINTITVVRFRSECCIYDEECDVSLPGYHFKIDKQCYTDEALVLYMQLYAQCCKEYCNNNNTDNNNTYSNNNNIHNNNNCIIGPKDEKYAFKKNKNKKLNDNSVKQHKKNANNKNNINNSGNNNNNNNATSSNSIINNSNNNTNNTTTNINLNPNFTFIPSITPQQMSLSLYNIINIANGRIMVIYGASPLYRPYTDVSKHQQHHIIGLLSSGYTIGDDLRGIRQKQQQPQEFEKDDNGMFLESIIEGLCEVLLRGLIYDWMDTDVVDYGRYPMIRA